ncbi:tRNA lysidine(34) synthetase TilS [Marinomonas sp. 2405UD68-3]|uniref:tRNA lysidine(34) synthetase TilS n=1 Tax=Marinomonas sp. 2405UD68-3 TaxID=3391835 RepID=UPI0039C9BACD
MSFEYQKEDVTFLQSGSVETIVVGLSGGVDSVVLLHSLIQLKLKKRVIAVHVHHGLSINADDWSIHCETLCKTINVPFYSHRVELDLSKGSLEENARDARYKIFERYVDSHSVLLLGHHMGDQAETVLFRLLRGTGGRGLSGIPHSRVFSDGFLLRPLMHLSKQAFYNYAMQHGLTWVEDESNDDVRFSRNKIRHDVLPLLRELSPSIDEHLSNTANRVQVDYKMLDHFSSHFIRQRQNKWGGLRLTDLHELAIEEQVFWLQNFLRMHDINATYVQLKNMALSLTATVGQQPLIELSGKRLQRFRECLYVLPQDISVQAIQISSGMKVNRAFDSLIVTAEGLLELRRRPNQIDLLMPSGNHRSLKKWFNDQRIPVWWREHLPYVFQNERLVAIGNLWIDPNHADVEVSWIPNNTLAFPCKEKEEDRKYCSWKV